MWIVTRPGSIVAIVLIWLLRKPKQNAGASWFAVRLQERRGAQRQRVEVETDFLTCVDSLA